jgi:Type IV secretion system pilin
MTDRDAHVPSARAQTTTEKEEMTRKLTLALALTAALALTLAPAALAASDINSVLSNLRVWLAGLLAALATLFLTIGGIRYLLAGGDPAALERAKGSIKAAIIGYALALLAPVLASVVQRVVGG